MNIGWVRLHRKIRDNPIYKNSKAVHCWVECLLRANHKEGGFFLGRKKITLKPGEFIFGRTEFGKSVGISGSTAWFWLLQFEVDSMVDIKKTSKGCLCSIKKWKEYQILDSIVDNKKTIKKQQKNTDKNDKNEKNDFSLRGPEAPDAYPSTRPLHGSVQNGEIDGGTQKLEIVKGVTSAEVNEVLHVFYTEAKLNNVKFEYGHKGFRKAAEELIIAHGKDQVVAVAQEAIRLRKIDQYVPAIVNPFDLRDKWMKLVAYAEKKSIEPPKKQWVFTAKYD
jgi:hypothetical protein